ncbi:MAG TPA: multiheme c-type cytochrome [Polyangiaceae bacterium]|nr:multiheme c-type cytochrome [Polyangiaceae bacterium]
MTAGWRAASSAACGVLLALGCGNGESTPPPAAESSRAELMNPETCAGCHPKHYDSWASSMHAYASDDPLFQAMNARGQREAAIGPFCLKCHAPMAVRTGATTDGSNLAELGPELKGVTCYFCHSVDRVEGTHDNPLHLAEDGVMRGEYEDPAENAAHRSAYSPLLDRDRLESATLCGACHDIVNGHGTHIERTFAEWKSTVFSQEGVGTTCGQCHMDQSKTLEPAAEAPGVFARRTHAHDFPGVDLPLTSWPGSDELAAKTQAFLDTTLQSALCVRGAGAVTDLRVVLDNVAAGHSFPSGAAQDRRAWVHLTAYAKGKLIYESGNVPDGTSVTSRGDPDVWSMRDCLLDADDHPVHMFWEAKDVESNLLPGQLTFDVADPRFYQTHFEQKYPRDPEAFLVTFPDRVTVEVRLAAFGLDVFDDLVASGDLADTDADTVTELRDAIATYRLGSVLEWTPDTAEPSFIVDGLPMSCVTDTALNVRAATVPAVNHVRCSP